MTPSAWVLVALAPTIPVIAAVSYIKGRSTGRMAQTDDAVGRLSCWLYQVLHANPINTPVFIEASRPEAGRYVVEVLNHQLLDTDVPDEEQS